MKKLVQRREPTIVAPAQYAKRFQEFVRKAFQSEPRLRTAFGSLLVAFSMASGGR